MSAFCDDIKGGDVILGVMVDCPDDDPGLHGRIVEAINVDQQMGRSTCLR